jgi:hypothetical protein
MLDVVGFAGDRGLDVENLAGLIETNGGASDTSSLLHGVVFAGSLGLLVGLGEGAAEDPRSGDDNLGDDAMSLGRN